MFIRKCYRDLKRIVFDMKIDKVRITGNPGIGKTFFGYYLLYLLALRNEGIIIYENYHLGAPIIFDGKEAYYSHDISSYLSDEQVWYIVDGQEPKDVDARTILICSLKTCHYTNFDKYDGEIVIRFMPIWSWDEIVDCRKFHYKDSVTVETAKKCFLRWGGIPRYVLQRANRVDYQSKLDIAVSKCKIDIFDFVGESEGRDTLRRLDLSHKLVNTHTNLPIDYETRSKDLYNVDYYDLKYDQHMLDVFYPLKRDKYGREPYTMESLKFASVYVMENVTANLDKDCVMN